MWVEKAHVSLQRKPFVLVAEASSTLFPCENWDSFGKEYFLKLTGFMVDICSVCSKLTFSDELKKEMYFSKETVYVRSFCNYHIISLWKMSKVLKGILHENQNVQGRDRLILFQTGLYSWVDKTHVFVERKSYVLEAGPSSTVFTWENWVSFRGNTSCISYFSVWRKAHFVPNRSI
jgi:hypothetical protein